MGEIYAKTQHDGPFFIRNKPQNFIFKTGRNLTGFPNFYLISFGDMLEKNKVKSTEKSVNTGHFGKVIEGKEQFTVQEVEEAVKSKKYLYVWSTQNMFAHTVILQCNDIICNLHNEAKLKFLF